MPTLRAMLRLDEDFSLFYQLTDRDPELSWARSQDAARLLRAPTAYEDLVNALLLCRASAAQAGAGALHAQLCARLGPRAPSGRHAFPSASAMAAQPLSFYQSLGQSLGQDLGRDLGAGRLARPLHALAVACCGGPGGFFPEALRRGPLSTAVPADLVMNKRDLADRVAQERDLEDRLASFLLSLDGFGPRATAVLLPWLGSYDGIHLTPQVRAAWQRRRAARPSPSAHDQTGQPGPSPSAHDQTGQPGTSPSAIARGPDPALYRAILARVARFAPFRGLALSLLLFPPSRTARPQTRSGRARAA